MKPLRTRLQKAHKHLRLPWEALERDYVLSWMLAGVAKVDSLRETLVFKGGTALKKCHFGDYRFSEDLDFSGLEGVPTGDAMERAIREACNATVRLLDEYAPVEIVCERYTEEKPHPGGQDVVNGERRGPIDLAASQGLLAHPRRALATYFLMYLVVKQFGNSNFIPGLIVIGSFVVPFSVVVLFFELNVPRNVSI
jgi:hypothetical protein